MGPRGKWEDYSDAIKAGYAALKIQEWDHALAKIETPNPSTIEAGELTREGLWISLPKRPQLQILEAVRPDNPMSPVPRF
jgi:hypothetical protein